MQRNISNQDNSSAPVSPSSAPEALSSHQSNAAVPDGRDSDPNVNTPGETQEANDLEGGEQVSTDETINGRGYIAFFSELSSKPGAVVTVAHACLGLALLILGCVIRASVEDTPSLHPAFSGTFPSPDESFPFTESPWLPRSILLGRGFFHPCLSIICNPYLGLICVCIGCVFIFCSISSGLMITKKRQEYACCHLVWLSLSALCSITLASACIMGLKKAIGEGKGAAAFTCLLVVINIFEAFACLLDIFNISQHFTSFFGPRSPNEESSYNPRFIRRDPRPSINTDLQHSQRRGQQNEGGSSRTIHRTGGGRQSARSGTARESQRSNRQTQQRSATLGNRRRRNENDSMRSIRSRENRREGRDSHLLHPSHAHTRHRGRRRPILRAQNHYVLVPAPISRSRASSRGGRGFMVGDRRARGDMPMFVIPNHDRYIRALNQSIDTEETRQNRGSVPADVVHSVSTPTLSTDTPKENAAAPTSVNLTHTETQDAASEKVEIVSEDFRRRSSKEILASKDPPTYEVENPPIIISNESTQEKNTGGPGKRPHGPKYSVVRRSKEGNQVKQDLNAIEMKEVEAVHSSTMSSLQNSLASKLSRVAAVVMDGQRENASMDFYKNSSPLNSDVMCSPPPPTPDSLPDRDMRPMTLSEGGYSSTHLYTTSSEGDFSTISVESGAASDTPRDIGPLNFLSSDSGLAEMTGNFTPTTKFANYYNVPPYGAMRTSVDLSSVSHGSPRSYPPVSPRTPAYENIDVSSGSPPKPVLDVSAFPFSS